MKPMRRNGQCATTADGRVAPRRVGTTLRTGRARPVALRARPRSPGRLAVALLLAATTGATPASAATPVPVPGTAPPDLLARATGAAYAPVSLFLSDAPLETVLQLAAEAADLELELSRPLEGTLSGTVEGTLGDVLRTVAARTDVLYDIEADLLEVLPASERREARLVVDTSDAALKPLLQDDLGRRLPGNTVELDGSELRVAGHPAFVARTLATARAAERPLGPVPAAANPFGDATTVAVTAVPAPAAAPLAAPDPDPVPDSVSAPAPAGAPAAEATSRELPRGPADGTRSAEPAGPLDALDDIPGFDTF